MKSRRSILRSRVPCCWCALALSLWSVAGAEEPPAELEPQTGWSNTTDLGLSVTTGNSETDGVNLDSLLRWDVERAGFRLQLQGWFSNAADDRFEQVDPGFSWEPAAEPPEDFTTTLVDPDKEPDVEKYFVDARYERSLKVEPRLKPGTMSWHIGASWRRDLDAGVRNRTVAYSGIGHVWWNREDLKFSTIYSLSWTSREEEIEDPEKDDEFPGFRYNWIYENRWGKLAVFHHEWTFNVNLDDFSDYSTQMTSTLRVPLSQRLSMATSVHWLYNSLPALEDIDLVGLVIVVDPDGVPGSGDELFETVESGGAPIDLGTVAARKEKLDTVVTMTLGVSF